MLGTVAGRLLLFIELFLEHQGFLYITCYYTILFWNIRLLNLNFVKSIPFIYILLNIWKKSTLRYSWHFDGHFKYFKFKSTTKHEISLYHKLFEHISNSETAFWRNPKSWKTLREKSEAIFSWVHIFLGRTIRAMSLFRLDTQKWLPKGRTCRL